MKRIVFAVLALSLVVLGFAGIVPSILSQVGVQGANRHVFTIDIAVDCRTAVTGFNRGDTFMVNGKLFPAGTLPSGAATNDPTEPVNGVAPIGDWLVRGQHALPLPPALAPLYTSAPGDFATAYFVLDRGQSALFT